MKRLVGLLSEHRKALVASAASFAVYLAIAVILTWPLVAHINQYYFSPELPGDGIGTIAENWYSQYAGETGADSSVTTLYGYPFGYNRKGMPVYPLSNGLMNQLTRVGGAQGAYNLLILFSFPLAGLLMFILLYYLGLGTPASFLGGFLYAFSPWHTSRAYDQASLTGIHVLPLFLLALIVFWRRRDLASALFLAFASAVVVLTDIHFALFCVLIAAAWIIAALLVSRGRKGAALSDVGRGASRSGTLLLVLMVVAVAVLAAVPVIRDIRYKDPTVIAGGEQRDIYQAIALSANPWNYVVPPAHSLVWRGVTDEFIGKRLGFRTTNEVTAYPGIVTAGLAVVALVLCWGARRKRRRPDGSEEEDRPVEPNGADARERLRGAVLIFCLIAGAAAFVLSLAPRYRIGGLRLPMPSIIINKLLPFFRYFSRWSLVVTFCLCILAAIGFSALVRKIDWGQGKVWGLCLVLVALFALDVTVIPPLRAHDTARPPETLAKLADYPSSEPVAIYPLAQTHEYANLYYRYFQKDHRHPMLNGGKSGTEVELYRLTLKDLYAPYTARMLSGLGVEKVAVITGSMFADTYGDRTMWKGFDPSRMPDGYRQVARTKDGYIFEVTAKPAEVYPLFYSNFSAPAQFEDNRFWVAMQAPLATMLLVKRDSKGTGSKYTFSIDVSNPGKDGTLVATLDGKPAGSWNILGGQAGTVTAELDLPESRQELGFEWNGMPVLIDGKPFGSGRAVSAYLLMSSPALQQTGGGTD